MRSDHGWRRTELGTVATIERTVILPERIADGTKYLGLEHVDSSGAVVEGTVDSGALRSTKFGFTERHILYGKLRPYLRKVARPTFSGICSTDILPILPGPDLDRDFLFHFLRTPRIVALATARSDGVNLPRLSPKTLLQFPIPVPPLAAQRRIAAMLDKADAIRRKRRESLQLLDEFLRSAFLEMFGDPVRNAKGWEVVRLEECLAERPTIGTITPAVDGGEFKVVRVGQLGQHEVGLDKCGRVTVLPGQSERFIAREGDLLLARAIGSEDHLGKASLMQAVPEPALFDSHVMRLRVDTRRMSPSFLWHWLQTSGGRRVFLQRSGRTAVQFNINATQVSEVRIPLPPVKDQDRFLALAARARAAAAKQEAALRSTNELFDSLAERAFGPGERLPASGAD